MVNVLVGSLLGNAPTGFWNGTVLGTSLLLASINGRFIAEPIGQVFVSFGEDASRDRIIGCIGTVSSATIPVQQDNRIGQIDVLDRDRNLVTINAVIPNWASTIPKLGDKAIVIDCQPQWYVAIAQDGPDRERWLNQHRFSHGQA